MHVGSGSNGEGWFLPPLVFFPGFFWTSGLPSWAWASDLFHLLPYCLVSKKVRALHLNQAEIIYHNFEHVVWSHNLIKHAQSCVTLLCNIILVWNALNL